jgi:hypothetical protein
MRWLRLARGSNGVGEWRLASWRGGVNATYRR